MARGRPLDERLSGMSDEAINAVGFPDYLRMDTAAIARHAGQSMQLAAADELGPVEQAALFVGPGEDILPPGQLDPLGAIDGPRFAGAPAEFREVELSDPPYFPARKTETGSTGGGSSSGGGSWRKGKWAARSRATRSGRVRISADSATRRSASPRPRCRPPIAASWERRPVAVNPSAAAAPSARPPYAGVRPHRRIDAAVATHRKIAAMSGRSRRSVSSGLPPPLWRCTR